MRRSTSTTHPVSGLWSAVCCGKGSLGTWEGQGTRSAANRRGCFPTRAPETSCRAHNRGASRAYHLGRSTAMRSVFRSGIVQARNAFNRARVAWVSTRPADTSPPSQQFFSSAPATVGCPSEGLGCKASTCAAICVLGRPPALRPGANLRSLVRRPGLNPALEACLCMGANSAS